MSIILFFIFLIVGVIMGREWAAVEYQRKLLNAQADAAFWYDMAKRQGELLKRLKK